MSDDAWRRQPMKLVLRDGPEGDGIANHEVASKTISGNLLGSTCTCPNGPMPGHYTGCPLAGNFGIEYAETRAESEAGQAMTDPLRAALLDLLDNYECGDAVDARIRAALAADTARQDEGPGSRSAALHRAWVANGGDAYFGPLFWDEVVARFSEVAAFIEAADTARPECPCWRYWQSDGRCVECGRAADTAPLDLNVDIEAEYYRQRGFGPGVPLYAKGPSSCSQTHHEHLARDAAKVDAALAADTARPTDHIFIHRQHEVVCAVAGCTHPPLAADTARPEVDIAPHRTTIDEDAAPMPHRLKGAKTT